MPPTVRRNPSARSSAPMIRSIAQMPAGRSAFNSGQSMRRYNVDESSGRTSTASAVAAAGTTPDRTVVLALIGIGILAAARRSTWDLRCSSQPPQPSLRAAGAVRRPDRCRQSPAARPRPGDRGRQRRHARRGDHGRRRSLQADQRRTRPRCRRPGAACSRRRAAPRGARSAMSSTATATRSSASCWPTRTPPRRARLPSAFVSRSRVWRWRSTSR